MNDIEVDFTIPQEEIDVEPITQDDYDFSIFAVKGDKGDAGENGSDGQDGRDGAIQYTAGENITIDENNVISASGGKKYYLGNITEFGASSPLNLDDLEVGSMYVMNMYTSTYIRFYISATVDNTVATGYINMLMTPSDSSITIHYISVPTANSSATVLRIKYNDEKGYNTATVKCDMTREVNKQLYVSMTSTTPMMNVEYSQTISGKKTFSTLPESSVVPTKDSQLVNKKYVDDQVGAINTILATLTTPGGN